MLVVEGFDEEGVDLSDDEALEASDGVEVGLFGAGAFADVGAGGFVPVGEPVDRDHVERAVRVPVTTTVE